MSLKKFLDVPCVAEPHKSLNHVKGVFTCFDIRRESEEVILENLRKKDKSITDVRRISVRRGEELVPTNSYIVTFNSHVLPTEIRVAYLKVRVRVYVPNPMRCFKCQRFGHTKQHCKSVAQCAKCSSPAHGANECNSVEPKCVNCKGGHPSYSKDCQRWKDEKEIMAIMTKDKLSFNEARKQYRAAHPLQKTFSEVTKASAGNSALSETELKALARKMGYQIIPFNNPPTPVRVDSMVRNLTPRQVSPSGPTSPASSQSRSSSASSTRVNIHSSPKLKLGNMKDKDGFVISRRHSRKLEAGNSPAPLENTNQFSVLSDESVKKHSRSLSWSPEGDSPKGQASGSTSPKKNPPRKSKGGSKTGSRIESPSPDRSQSKKRSYSNRDSPGDFPDTKKR